MNDRLRLCSPAGGEVDVFHGIGDEIGHRQDNPDRYDLRRQGPAIIAETVKQKEHDHWQEHVKKRRAAQIPDTASPFHATYRKSAAGIFNQRIKVAVIGLSLDGELEQTPELTRCGALGLPPTSPSACVLSRGSRPPPLQSRQVEGHPNEFPQ